MWLIDCPDLWPAPVRWPCLCGALSLFERLARSCQPHFVDRLIDLTLASCSARSVARPRAGPVLWLPCRCVGRGVAPLFRCA